MQSVFIDEFNTLIPEIYEKMKLPFTKRSRLLEAENQLKKTKAAHRKEISELKEKISKHREERDQLRNYHHFPIANPRVVLASLLEGEGIEIGALHAPLQLTGKASVKYVDYKTREQNIKNHPELDAEKIVHTDYICNGEKLEVIPDESQDFVIANHMVEHCINPLATIQQFLRVLKPGGKLFIALPDKRYTFDIKRDVTPFSHIQADYESGHSIEQLETYQEWSEKVHPGFNADNGFTNQANIHFHVWTQSEVVEMFVEMNRKLHFPIEIDWMTQNGSEVIVVAHKTTL